MSLIQVLRSKALDKVMTATCHLCTTRMFFRQQKITNESIFILSYCLVNIMGATTLLEE